MFMIHEDRIFDVSRTSARPCKPPAPVLAANAHSTRCAVLTEDLEVFTRTSERDGWRSEGVLDAPRDVTHAALSADGRLVALSYELDTPDWGAEIRVFFEEVTRRAPLPDFIQSVTSLACHPTGSSWGYGFLTSQPWSLHGSYGDRLQGYAVVDVDGDCSWLEADTRSFDEERTFDAVWTHDLTSLMTYVLAEDDETHWETEGIEWSRPIDDSNSILLVDVPEREVTDELILSVHGRGRPAVSPDGGAFATLVDGALTLLVRHVWFSGDPGAFVWGSGFVAASLDGWPEVVLLRDDLEVVRTDWESVMIEGEELEQ